ncbi:hypothetical protein AGMMS49975_29880 [Clostridia bacterium]|nr:hypothetical protein AGMMS49975_29880 [Clostridia bacterium]
MIKLINSSDLYDECLESVCGYEKYEKRVEPVLQFIKWKCEEYLKTPLPLNGVGLKKMRGFK